MRIMPRARHWKNSMNNHVILKGFDVEVIKVIFCSLLSPLHLCLSSGDLHTSEAAEIFTETLLSRLKHDRVLRRRCRPPSNARGPNKERGIVKLTRSLAKEKNRARRSFHDNPTCFLNGVRAHNKAVKASRQSTLQRSTRQQEREFRSNPWSFSKSVCNSKNNPTSQFFNKSTCQCPYWNQWDHGTHPKCQRHDSICERVLTIPDDFIS